MKSPRISPDPLILALLLMLGLIACRPVVPPAASEPGIQPPPILVPPATPLTVDDLSLFERALIPAARDDVARIASSSHPTRYQLDVRFDPQSLTVSGQEVVRYTNNEDVPLNAIYFRLFPNLPGFGQTEVSALSVDGVSVTPQLELGGSALRVPLMPSRLPGAAVTVQIEFVTQVPTEITGNYGALAYANNVLALAGFYPMIPVYDNEGWNVEIAPPYGDMVYADTSFYLVRFTLPAGWTVAASGVTVAIEDHIDGTTTWTLAAGLMRDFNLVASPRYLTSEIQVGPTAVRSFYQPEDEAGGRRALDYAVRALQYFNETFGTYPFTELDVAATPTTAGGIEYPGLIVIAQRLYEEPALGPGTRVGGFFEWATVHETAHQWWYSLVGSDQVDEPWLDEALTQYATLMYVEAIYGQTAAAAARWIVFEQPYRRLVEEGRDQPVGQSVRAFNEADYGPVVYAKGPLFFQALRDKMGDAAFRAFLQAYFKAYRYRIATPEALLTVAEETCRCDVQSVYEHWIREASSETIPLTD